jgi:hypothetical protein
VQSLIEISSLIRSVPNRVKNSAEDYINRDYIRAAWSDLAAAPAGRS